MASTNTERGGLDGLFQLLVSYRLLVYLLGTIAIGTPLFLAVGLGIEVSAAARTTIVVVSLGLMILTYVGERRLGLGNGDEHQPGDRADEYSFRTRATVAMAVVGIAVGVYLVLAGDPIIGLVFVGGAFLFARLAYGQSEPMEEP